MHQHRRTVRTTPCTTLRGRKAAAGQQDLCHNSVLHGVRHLPRASNVLEARSTGDTDLGNTVATNSAIGEVVAGMAGAAAASTQCTPPAGAEVMYSSCKSLCCSQQQWTKVAPQRLRCSHSCYRGVGTERAATPPLTLTLRIRMVLASKPRHTFKDALLQPALALHLLRYIPHQAEVGTTITSGTGTVYSTLDVVACTRPAL